MNPSTARLTEHLLRAMNHWAAYTHGDLPLVAIGGQDGEPVAVVRVDTEPPPDLAEEVGLGEFRVTEGFAWATKMLMDDPSGIPVGGHTWAALVDTAYLDFADTEEEALRLAGTLVDGPTPTTRHVLVAVGVDDGGQSLGLHVDCELPDGPGVPVLDWDSIGVLPARGGVPRALSLCLGHLPTVLANGPEQ